MEAARRAGYKAPERAVERLKKRPRVRAALAEIEFQAAQKAKVHRSDVEGFFRDLMRGQIRTGQGRLQRVGINQRTAGATGLAKLNAEAWAPERRAETMQVRVDLGFTDEMLEIMRGPGTERNKADALYRLCVAKGLK
jgi:hypothetical protein